MTATRIIIGCDTETTGLDECQDDILEIALVAIETPSFKIVDSYSAILKPSAFGMSRLAANDFVLKMHEKSGLLDLVRGEKQHLLRECGGNARLEEAEAEALAFYRKHMGPTEKSPMFGCNPNFDRMFLNVHMNKLERAFHYRNLDVNALWLLREYVTGADPTRAKAGTAHRALADCEQAVANVHDHFGWITELMKAVA